MPKFTIITPMYNSFNLMERYFESIINQTYKDFEVIIVDDCSTDGSYESAQQYVAKLPVSVSVLRSKTNAGPGNARNIGIDNAKGEWITFVDNDDWIDVNLLEKVVAVLEENSVECVIYDYYIKRDDSQRACKSMYIGEKGLVSISQCMAYIRNHSIGKFYKRDKIKDIRFPHLRRCEDVAFVCPAVDACGSAYYLAEPLYYYYQRQTSLSNNKIMDETDLIKAFTIVENSLYEKYPKEIEEKSVPDLLYGVLLMMCKAKKPKKDICSYIKTYEMKYPNWYECNILSHLGTAKRLFLFSARMRICFPMRVYSRLHEVLL